MNPNIKKGSVIDNAWTQLAPAVAFSGIARADYETALQAASDAENAVAAAQAGVVATQGARDVAVMALADMSKQVVNGVKGNATYGPNSDLYEAMGYVRDSQRRSGLHRTPTPPPAP